MESKKMKISFLPKIKDLYQGSSDPGSDISSDDEPSHDEEETVTKPKKRGVVDDDPLSAVLARFFSVKVGNDVKSIAQILEEINQKLDV